MTLSSVCPLPRARLIVTATVVLILCAFAGYARAASPGQPDPSFGGGTVLAPLDAIFSGVAARGDGSVVAAGGATLAEFSSGGELTSSSGAAGTARGVALQPDGKLIVVGGDSSNSPGVRIERFNANGTPDTGFGSGGVVSTLAPSRGQGNAVAIEPNGEIVAVGTATIPTGTDQGYPGVALVRVSPSGHVDTSEVLDFLRFSTANAVAIQGDGKIVIAGSVRGDLQTTQVLAARFNANGSVDPSFASNGLFLNFYSVNAAYSAAYGVAIQGDGKIVLAGSVLDGATGPSALVVRLNSNGTQDVSFHLQGFVKLPASASSTSYAGQPPYPGALAATVVAGKIVLAGYYDNFTIPQVSLWALNPDGSLDSGFGSGGRVLGPGGQATAITPARGGTVVIAGWSSGTGLVARYAAPAPVLAPAPGVALPPGGPGGGPPPLRVTTSLPRSVKLSSALDSGVAITLRCNEVCRALVSLRISQTVAMSLHLPNGSRHPRMITIGSLATTLKHVNRDLYRPPAPQSGGQACAVATSAPARGDVDRAYQLRPRRARGHRHAAANPLISTRGAGQPSARRPTHAPAHQRDAPRSQRTSTSQRARDSKLNRAGSDGGIVLGLMEALGFCG